jgi:predicted O-linked N-acetylglucosamine transferase (SPINDLY family)
VEEGVENYRRALALDPTRSGIATSLLLALHYRRFLSAEAMFAEHLRWNEQYARPLARFIQPHAHSPEPERRLRIGYVSADFREHAVAFFIENLLAGHDGRARTT